MSNMAVQRPRLRRASDRQDVRLDNNDDQEPLLLDLGSAGLGGDDRNRLCYRHVGDTWKGVLALVGTQSAVVSGYRLRVWPPHVALAL